MGRGAGTREAIIDEASRRALRSGLEGLSLGGLADALGLSKSGLFAHFKAKEVLQMAVLDEVTDRFNRQVIEPALERPRGRARLEALFGRYLDWMSGGCLFSVVAQEVDKLPPAVAAAFVTGQAEWQRTIERVASNAVDSAADPAEVVFEFVGLALAYQQAVKVFQDTSARQRALRVFQRRLESTT